MSTPLSALPPRTMADQNRRITILIEPVTSLQGLTAETLNGGIDASCRVTQADTRLSATGSASFADPAVCEDSGATAPGASAFEATLGVFRFFDEEDAGQADSEGDEVFTAVRKKNTEVVVVERHVNKAWDEPFAEGDEYSAYRVVTDNWQRPSDIHSGYIKATVPLFVQDAELNGVVAASEG